MTAAIVAAFSSALEAGRSIKWRQVYWTTDRWSWSANCICWRDRREIHLQHCFSSRQQKRVWSAYAS